MRSKLFALVILLSVTHLLPASGMAKGKDRSPLKKGNQYPFQSPFLPGSGDAKYSCPVNTDNGVSVNAHAMNRTASVQLADSIYYWSWDTTSAAYLAVPFEKIIDIQYDGNNNVTGETWQTWNGFSWQNTSRGIYTYSPANARITDLRQTWNGSAWVNATLNTVTYDQNNNRTHDLRQNWSGSAWLNSTLSVYTYDVNNNQTGGLSQTWSGSSWSNISRQSNTYDVNNNRISELYQPWGGSAWVNHSLFNYYYDFNNNRVNSVGQLWVGSAWVNNQNIVSTYNTNNKLTSHMYEAWNGSAWAHDALYSITYDAYDNVISTSNQDWFGGGWYDGRLDSFFYDSNNNLIDYRIQNWSGFVWLNDYISHRVYDAGNYLVTETYTYWDTTGTMAEYGDSIIYYYHTVVGTQDVEAGKGGLSVYPNPVSDQLSVSGRDFAGIGKVEIYNLAGMKVYEANYSGYPKEIKADVSQLADGMYFLKVSSEKENVTFKMVKRTD